ncbi:MAG TPA: TonB-dependent receptor [Opitutaceae bacterium]|nr:TonB-dependent receptor [Opitutaceae bacterium]
MTSLASTRRLVCVAVCLPGLLLAAQAQTTASSPDNSSGDVVKLTPFSVNAESSNGYQVTSASTATRTNTPLIDIPQTVDIVTKEFWNDIGAVSFDQSFRYIANVFVRNRNAGSGDGVNLRGFETNGSIAVDGVRMGNSKRDLVGYERLEVVKGPPSAVQGRAGGTGLLNFILKKPELNVDATSLKYAFSTDEYNQTTSRVEFDSNYATHTGPKLAVRVAGAWEDGDDYIQFQHNHTRALYPSFRWKIDDRTDLVFVTELLDFNTPSREEGHGFAIYPAKARKLIPQFNTPNDPITALNLPYNFNIAGPGEIDREKVSNGTLFFTHRFADWLDFREVANLRYFGSNSFTYTGEDNTKAVVNSQYTGSIGWRRGTTTQGDLIGRYHPFSWLGGTTMVGYQYSDEDSRNTNYAGIPDAPFDKLDMAAIAASGFSESYYAARTVSGLKATGSTTAKTYNFGMYAQQDLSLLHDRLILTGGIRSDHDGTATRDLATGKVKSSANTTLNSYRYGATFKVRPHLALYAVKSVQTDPTRTVQRYNGLLAGDPRLGEYFVVSPLTDLEEFGVKGELFNGRLSFSADYWQMTKTGSTSNVLTNGVSMGKQITYGTQTEIEGARSQGYEFSAFGSITDRLSIIANYTKMNTSQGFTGQQNTMGWTSASNPGRIPLRFAPDWNVNVFAKYSFRNERGQGLELKAGVAAVGPLITQMTGYGLMWIPESQHSYDAGASYVWRRYNFDLMVTNIGNDPFLITRDQPPRTYRFSVSTRF